MDFFLTYFQNNLTHNSKKRVKDCFVIQAKKLPARDPAKQG